MKVLNLNKYKDELYSALSRDLADFEKNFLLIASGVLAFSITFIKDIVKIESADLFMLLFIAWFLFGVSICIMMLTFPYSAYTSDNLSECTNNFISENKLYDDNTDLTESQINEIKSRWSKIFNPSIKRLKQMRYLAMIIFFTGMVLFATFVGTNLTAEKNRKTETMNQVKEKRTIIIADSVKIVSKDSLIILK